MTEPTQPPSLRALRINRGLDWIAGRLDSWRPNDPMTVNAARSAALRYCIDTHPNDRVANAVLHDIVQALPPIHDDDTRAEYATRVRLRVQGVTA